MKLGLLFVAAGAGLWASDCSRTSTGMMPLTAPFFGAYKGMPGGLYPNNSNTRPAALEAAGLELVKQVQPRNAAGEIDPQNGRIVLISIGLSNTTQEFTAFQALAARDPEKSPQLVLADTAQGAWTADRILADPGGYWSVGEQRIAAAGVTDVQVQAAWLKEADANPAAAFPADANTLAAQIDAIIQTLPSRFPNLRLLYLSSRIYAGYADVPLNPEPFSYQSGFAVKWVIEQQSGKVPWVAWGPYLWADGVNARGDGLQWFCADFADDGTHPSAAGQLKVAQMLLSFFKADTTARPWFVRAQAAPAAPVVDRIVNAASYGRPIGTQGVATIFGSNLAGDTVSASSRPLPYGLAGTSVKIGGELAPLYYVSPTQINLVVPPTAVGSDVVVLREGVASAGIAAQISLFNEQLFSLDGSGTGAAAARHADGTLVSASAPAARGETIVLVGTGQGVLNPLILIPQPLPRVQVGGVQAELRYFGAAPGFPGVDQINVKLAPDTPVGLAVTVVMQLGVASNVVTLPVGN